MLCVKGASLISCPKWAICIQDVFSDSRSFASLLCLLTVCESLSKMAFPIPNRLSSNNSNQADSGALWQQAKKRVLWKTIEGFIRWEFLVQGLMEAIYLQKFCMHLWSQGDIRWSGLLANHCFLFPETALYGSSGMISASQTGTAAVPPGDKGNTGVSKVPLLSRDIPRGHQYPWIYVNNLWRW